jgi:hypothetical protein
MARIRIGHRTRRTSMHVLGLSHAGPRLSLARRHGTEVSPMIHDAAHHWSERFQAVASDTLIGASDLCEELQEAAKKRGAFPDCAKLLRELATKVKT